MIHEFRNPMPVETPLGYGMLVYARDGGTFANDVLAVVLHDGGLRYFSSEQLKFLQNNTFDIRTNEQKKKA